MQHPSSVSSYQKSQYSWDRKICSSQNQSLGQTYSTRRDKGNSISDNRIRFCDDCRSNIDSVKPRRKRHRSKDKHDQLHPPCLFRVNHRRTMGIRLLVFKRLRLPHCPFIFPRSSPIVNTLFFLFFLGDILKMHGKEGLYDLVVVGAGILMFPPIRRLACPPKP